MRVICANRETLLKKKKKNYTQKNSDIRYGVNSSIDANTIHGICVQILHFIMLYLPLMIRISWLV